jgi:hypothetical protein
MLEEPHRTEPRPLQEGIRRAYRDPGGVGCSGDDLTHSRDREEREQYMNSLERQMEHEREQIERTLERTTEDSDRRRKALEKLRSALPSFPGLSPVRDAAEREASTGTIRSDALPGREKSPRKPSDPRSWWRRMLGSS